MAAERTRQHPRMSSNVDPERRPGHFEFGPYRLDGERRALYRDGEFIPLTPKAAEMLLLLLEEAGRVVTKEQILARVWPGVVVEEGAIANNVSALRKALDAGFGGTEVIATIARRGYRLAVEVRQTAAANGPTAPDPSMAAAAPAQPVARDLILIAAIENKTGDPVFDETIRQALMLHLAQSPFIDLVSDRKVNTTLGYMGREGATVAGDVALEICQRIGAKAAITGSIFAIGEDYVIGLQAMHGATGDLLLAEQSRARGKGEVLRALDNAAIGLRTKLGESLASVHSYFRLFDEVATSSLDALKAYTVGRQIWFSHGDLAAMSHQLRAIELDPSFASAHSALAIACNNMGKTLDARRHMERAYALRERMSERERMRILANYHESMTGDLYRSVEALRQWQASPYAEGTSWTNCGSAYASLGQWDKALSMANKAWEVDPTAVVAGNIAVAQLALGLTESARRTTEDAFARGWGAFYLHLEAYQEAFLRDDRGGMRMHVDAVAGHAGEEDFLIAAESDTEAYYGRLGRARELTRRAVASALRADAVEMAGSWEGLAAVREALVGDFDRAHAGALAAREISPGRYVVALAGLAFALAGDEERAQAAAADLDRECPQNTLVQRYWLPSIRAAMAMGKGEWKAAIDALEPAETIELGTTLPFESGFMIPAYLRGLALAGSGRHGDATREYMKIVDRPTLIRNFVIYPLALRNAGLMGRFEPIWANADVELGPGR